MARILLGSNDWNGILVYLGNQSEFANYNK